MADKNEAWTSLKRVSMAASLIAIVSGFVLIAEIIRPEVSGWLFAFLNIAVFTLTIWWSASFLYRMDRARSGAEARFRAVAETASEAIISANAQGLVIYLNPAAEKMFGYAAAEMHDRPITLLMPERFRADHRRGLSRFLATGESQIIGRTVEVVGLRRYGDEFPIELSLATWRVGQDVFFTAILRNIQERKDAEEALRQANMQLAAANNELEAFSYSVSHDLRAPLRGIDGFSQALEEDYGQHLDAAARSYLSRIRAATQRMGRLIDDLLDLSQVSRKPLDPQRVDLTELASSIANDLKASHPERAVDFDIACGLEAIGDPPLLRIALENLLSNAWKYTGKHAHAHIEVGKSAGPNGTPTFFVRDDGVGFDMAYAHKLFAPFQRLHGSSEFPGTGVGLATVQRIIHRHGGSIRAEAGVERGATFYFTLPH